MQQKEEPLKILIATDHHLGFKEQDPIIGSDSFDSFEECLVTANQLEVDFVLLGGDLFHDHQPSPNAYFRTSNILNANVFGERPIKFETQGFDDANYLKDLHKIKMPIFSIHGNHDSPVGIENISTLDQMNANNYINYFGRQNSIQNMKVVPFLVKKGSVKLAIYGIGHMKEERLNLALENQTIVFDRPLDEYEQADESYFNILVLHQNKYKGNAVGASKRNCILESAIPHWLNLVIWGHEHECIPRVVTCEQSGVNFLQPGSTTYTSLIEAESKQKHCFILTFSEGIIDQGEPVIEMSIDPYPLKQMRPLMYNEIVLSQSKINPAQEKLLITYIRNVLNQMLEIVVKDFPDNPKTPLLRLKIDHSDYPVIAAPKITKDFTSTQIANIGNCLQFRRRQKLESNLNKSFEQPEEYGPYSHDHITLDGMIIKSIKCHRATEKDNTTKIDSDQWLNLINLSVDSKRNMEAYYDNFYNASLQSCLSEIKLTGEEIIKDEGLFIRQKIQEQMQIFNAENMLKQTFNADDIIDQRDLGNIFAEEEKNLFNLPKQKKTIPIITKKRIQHPQIKSRSFNLNDIQMQHEQHECIENSSDEDVFEQVNVKPVLINQQSQPLQMKLTAFQKRSRFELPPPSNLQLNKLMNDGKRIYFKK